jgi:OOP family OmpA-OmpF porin
MRSLIVMTAFAVLAAGTATGMAQSSPSPEQIVKSLTPTSTSGPTRGLRIAPATPQAPSAQAPSAQAQPISAPALSLMVPFAFGSAELSPAATHALDNLGKALNDQTLATYRFRIEGHTDTVGTRPYNQQLSERRAVAVVDYIARIFHVDRGRIQSVGMGEDGLLIPTPDQTPEARNRRVQVVNIGS